MFLNAFGQSDVLIIHTPDTFYVYQLHLNKEQSNENTRVFMFDQFPEQMAKISNYSEGKLSGIEKTFYPSGEKYQTIVYVDGKLWGEYMEFTEEEKLQVRGNFVNDKEHGLWIDKTSGCTGRYKHGEKQGRWRCNEGSVPYTLFVYRKGILKRTKRK